MPKQKFFVHYLAFTIFFASLFSVFHKSEHVQAEFVHSVSGVIDFELASSSLSEDEHLVIEPLCDTCHVLSLIKVALHEGFTSLQLSSTGDTLINEQELPLAKAILRYYSRAPPAIT